MEYQNREFMIIGISELNLIDFSEVLETSIDTIRISKDGTKTFVKWNGDIIPASVSTLTTKEGPYTYDEIISILNTDEWGSNNFNY
jgi:hypothetical protein